MGRRRGHIDPLLPRDTVWQTWRDHPQKSAVRHALFQVHLWVGVLVAAYVFVMSVSGSVIVYSSELSTMGLSVKRLVDLHENWLAGAAGRVTNGIGALCLTLLCLTGAVIWWPGIAHWRRSLTVDWRQGFARIYWDLHSAVGFWCFLFVLMWALSGASLIQERLAAFSLLDPAGPVATWLSQLHFGQFTASTEAVWALLGLVPALLAFTGVFICCRRIIFHKPSNPRHAEPTDAQFTMAGIGKKGVSDDRRALLRAQPQTPAAAATAEGRTALGHPEGRASARL